MTKSGEKPFGDRLRELRDRSGHTMKSMALALGYRGASSYQRFEAPDAKVENQPLSWVRKVARALHGHGEPPITVTDLAFLLEEPPDLDSAMGLASTYSALGLPVPEHIQARIGAIPAALQATPVVGSVQASFWMTRAPAMDVPIDHIPVQVLNHDPDQLYALKVIGPSMNRYAPDGSHVVCLRYGGGPQRMQQGKIVHVQRERYGEFEWTLKQVRWHDGKAYLWPDSDDPAYQDPIALDGRNPDVNITLLGIVVKIVVDAP
jgi:SOS-response transcriptional repressor LexA